MTAPIATDIQGPTRGQSAAASRRIRERLGAQLAVTPLREARGLDPSGRLLLKMESFQPTGSFKLRGALGRISELSAAERALGVIAASTGNHGAAVAHAARLAGVEAMVVVPETTGEGRVRAVEAQGARVVREGAECGASERSARRIAEESGRVFVSPYNDPVVMAGQGTLALELLEQAPELARVYVAVGGGGLIGGVASVLKEARPALEVVGCSPRASYPMHASVAARAYADTPHLPTLSLATAGALEEGSVTLRPCIDSVDRWELVDEGDIAPMVTASLELERLLVEGAVGVALATWRRDLERGVAGEGLSCVVVCGGNLDRADLERILAAGARP